jgi:nucleotide-binding universal stress UspA family protein
MSKRLGHSSHVDSTEREPNSTPWPGESRYHGVVVGVDGSPASRAAVDWAARDAVLRDVPLTVVHAMPAPAIGTGTELANSKEFGTADTRRAEELVTEALEWVCTAISVAPRVPVRHRVMSAPIVPAMVEMSKDADMMVVGCRGRGAVSGLLLGSVSSALVHHAHCPVAVIHDATLPLPDPAHAPVAVGIDGSPASELATAMAFDEASRRGVGLIAVHVWGDDTDDFVNGTWDSLGGWADEILGERLAGWTTRYPDVTVCRVVEQNRPARSLLEHAKKAQLLVVGSRGRGGYVAWLLGSVSSAVAHGGRVPVIVARQPWSPRGL